MKKTILLLISFLVVLSAKAQVPDYANTKEKVYLQMNHVYFEPGDTIYYKAYVVNAQTNVPTIISTVLNVDIISPSGNILSQLKHPINIGYSEGGYVFGDSLPGGIYKIRAYTTWMQNEKDSTWFSKSLYLQRVIAPRILATLDFPEKGYGPGDTIKAIYSIRTPDNKPLAHYTGQFMVSIEGKQYKSDIFKTDTAGKAIIRAVLPGTLTSDDGLLNVTVIASGFTESISRSIPIELNKIDLQFMPEGGTLVAGLPTVLAFKAINDKGKPVDVKGKIIDDKGAKIAPFSSYHGGMGILPFTPVQGRKYTALIGDKKYPVPQATEDGMIMNLMHRGGQLYAKISTTADDDITLTAAMREHVYYTTNATIHKGVQLIKIDTMDFPTGIVVFTLRNSQHLKVAERVAFMNKHHALQVNISTDKSAYMPREKVKMTILTTDTEGQPIPANLSLSVIDDKLWTMADDKQDHIISWLLMSSELKGRVEEPQFYFKQDEPKADSALDMLMLTQGYRYFQFTDIVNTSNRLVFTPDKLNILSGSITNKNGIPAKTKLYLFNTNRQLGVVQTTSNSGQFFFSDLDPGADYFLIAEGEKKDSFVINVAQNGIGNNPQEAGMFKPLKTGLKESVAAYPAMAINAPSWADKATHLNDVVVVGYGVTNKRNLTGSISVISKSEIMSSNPSNVLLSLQGKLAGIIVNQPSGNPGDAVSVQIRGINSLAKNDNPLYVIDGIPFQGNIINTINPAEILTISILKGADATAIYGSRAANGVILFTTKKSQNLGRIRFSLSKSYSFAFRNIKTQAANEIFSQVPVFYAPKYQAIETEKKTDFRETIYWNPTIQTDRYGKASVEFYNSDANTTFRAITEGIGYNGSIGRTEHTYAVHDMVSVDAKIPPYINVGDNVQIPVVLTNYSNEDVIAKVYLTLPPGVSGDTAIREVPVKKAGSVQVNIPVTPYYKMSGNIRINVNSQALFLPFTAEEKGFPIHVVFSGNQSKDTSFIFSNPVTPINPAMSLDLQTVTDQIIDAIKSMLREPHGCFEQTSSSTYPNIFILQLMQHAIKRDYKLESKAKEYLQEGYARLVKFETSENGFEWFGHTPAHVALTAYGLMEFTAMKEFIEVDKNMLNRTEKFLLDHRDGKGKFKPTPGGLDEFKGVPVDVMNAYIVYALAQAGKGGDIQLEYETARKDAQLSNDGYQLAIMALAAAQLQKTEDFNDLMNRLDKLFINGQLAARTSIVASQGVSLYVETMALYAMALMREPAPRKARIAQIMSGIQSRKNYYGFGSTQGNIQALAALTAYYNMEKSTATDSGTFTLNGHPAKPGEKVAFNYLSKENKFSVRYSGKEGLPYTFTCDYFTNTPPTSEHALLKLETVLSTHHVKVGETVRMNINVTNTSTEEQGMAVVKVGVPGGLSWQPWQLKELMDKEKVAYYEIFDNYLVFYWRGMKGKEVKKIALDLKVDVAGTYQGKASAGYLYYQPENIYWQEGETVEIMP
ncbi:TonB-dependent receptor plug domain-containing protein [Chitinophaga sancti]|uniref:TonB-dependent outer membrane receptor, SusC/RagA subfamily, signature region n=1 Tax=Chitinophaga sancti TaxID=1004 RepID=A0A1K1S730_9BACT|nr:TonB-dependent receptor plug domain-containing protein [Chitinophaga sancti]WQD62214.1 TonB-dependent receptor plug domain-containing protein [Chitinophaga sancti]WQG92217.1 TonB-dependent receptor plug domain-containing protein [Chitinophaga sancti]SFW79876.1 TonB-dependent outer membrane receptor, SusC/RagA subfamily, signature region [Chitinophaga sancti]